MHLSQTHYFFAYQFIALINQRNMNTYFLFYIFIEIHSISLKRFKLKQ